MHRPIMRLAGLVLICGVSGCLTEEKSNSLKQQLSAETEFCDILSQINTEQAARTWLPTLKAIKKRIVEIDQDARKLELKELRFQDELDEMKETLGPLVNDLEKTSLDRLAVELKRLSTSTDPDVQAAWKILEPEMQGDVFPKKPQISQYLERQQTKGLKKKPAAQPQP